MKYSEHIYKSLQNKWFMKKVEIITEVCDSFYICVEQNMEIIQNILWLDLGGSEMPI